MATKKKAIKKAGLVPGVRRSARQVWLAGVGALSMAEEEGGKLFEQLVKRGSTYESKNKERLTAIVGNVRDVRTDMSGVFGRVTAPVNNAVAKALNRLGVPTRKEIAQLTRRVEELTRAVERSKAPARRAPRRKAPAVETAAAAD